MIKGQMCMINFHLLAFPKNIFGIDQSLRIKICKPKMDFKADRQEASYFTGRSTSSEFRRLNSDLLRKARSIRYIIGKNINFQLLSKSHV